MTTEPAADRLDDLRSEYAQNGYVASDGAVWLFSQLVVLREQVARQKAAVPVPPPTDQTAAVASCPGYETSPNPCRCPCYGCKHHCGAHDPAAVLPEPTDRAAVEEMRAAWEALARCAREDADRLVELGRQVGLTLREGRTVSVRTAIEAIGAELLRLAADRAAILTEAADAVAKEREATDVNVAVYPRWDARQKSALSSAERLLRRLAAEAQPTTKPETGEQPEDSGHEWCKCASCWGWFVEEHPGEDLDELGRDLGWWSGLPVHRDAPAGVGQDGAQPQ